MAAASGSKIGKFLIFEPADGSTCQEQRQEFRQLRLLPLRSRRVHVALECLISCASLIVRIQTPAVASIHLQFGCQMTQELCLPMQVGGDAFGGQQADQVLELGGGQFRQSLIALTVLNDVVPAACSIVPFNSLRHWPAGTYRIDAQAAKGGITLGSIVSFPKAFPD